MIFDYNLLIAILNENCWCPQKLRITVETRPLETKENQNKNIRNHLESHTHFCIHRLCHPSQQNLSLPNVGWLRLNQKRKHHLTVIIWPTFCYCIHQNRNSNALISGFMVLAILHKPWQVQERGVKKKTML